MLNISSAQPTMSAAAEMSIETPASFVFLPDQLKILQDNLTVVQSKKAKEKHKHIKSIRKQILELPVSKALPLEQREDLKIAINSWFSRRTRGGSHKIKFGKTWNGRLVMYDERRETVNQLKAELFDKAKTKSKAKGKDGPRNGFDYFQLALTHYWNELDDEEKDRYRTIAAKWNSEGVSKEKKRE